MENRMRTAALSLAGAALLAVTAARADQPTISFEKNQVMVDSISNGGRVACYGVAHDFQDSHPELLRWGREGVDDDGDGAVAIDLPRDVPRLSVWVCADVATGRIALASPTSEPVVETVFSGIGTEAKGPLASFGVDGDTKDLFLLRPGDGAWLAVAGDGGANDADGVADGRIIAAVETFRGIGAVRAAPAALHAGGTIVVIDPMSFELSVVAVGKQ
jgi:hypothetical protein